MSILIDRVRDPIYFSYLGQNLSFLEDLTHEESCRVRGLFCQIKSPDPVWRQEVQDVQPWVQVLYDKLAEIFELIVNRETRRGGRRGENYADHYLTHKKWSVFCCTECNKIDYTKCWAFETKGNWSPVALNNTIVQCHRYSGLLRCLKSNVVYDTYRAK